VKVRDYAMGDCVADDTAAIQAAIAQWQTLQADKTVGALDFGSGCYRTTDTLHFGRVDGGFVFGTIRGDSPLLAQIHPDASVAVGADMMRLKYSSVSGLGFFGQHTPNSIGLLVSNIVPGMGSNNIDFNLMSFQRFDTCLQLGETSDVLDGAAAAALTFTQLSVSYCNRGIYETAFNTLDVLYNSTSITFNHVGFDAAAAHQAFFNVGSGSGNDNTFRLRTAGNFFIRGWREEPPTDLWIRAGCCAAGTFVTVSDSMAYGSLTSDMPSIEGFGDVYLTVQNSFIGGRIAPDPMWGSVVITNSAIYDSAPWVASVKSHPTGSGMFYRTEGNYKPAGPANPAESGIIFADQSGRAVDGHVAD
jgi:hypothetical protein